MARVAVIMGVYNEEKKLIGAIESVLAQSFQDWILLVCDDGSSDGSRSILEDYKNRYSDKIVLFRNERNRGLTYCLNKMIKNTNAEYIARMDADDVSRQDRLHRQVEFLDQNKEYAIVGTSIAKYDENGIFAKTIYPKEPNRKSFLWNSPFAHPSIMIRSDILKELKGYKDEPRTLRCEDYDLWMRLYEKGYKGYNIQDTLLEYYEGRNAYKKRKYKYRIAEMKTRYYGYKKLGLLPQGLPFVVKPLLVGVIPGVVVKNIKAIKNHAIKRDKGE